MSAVGVYLHMDECRVDNGAYATTQAPELMVLDCILDGSEDAVVDLLIDR